MDTNLKLKIIEARKGPNFQLLSDQPSITLSTFQIYPLHFSFYTKLRRETF